MPAAASATAIYRRTYIERHRNGRISPDGRPEIRTASGLVSAVRDHRPSEKFVPNQVNDDRLDNITQRLQAAWHGMQQ